jgi:hypothetical protein
MWNGKIQTTLRKAISFIDFLLELLPGLKSGSVIFFQNVGWPFAD